MDVQEMLGGGLLSAYLDVNQKKGLPRCETAPFGWVESCHKKQSANPCDGGGSDFGRSGIIGFHEITNNKNGIRRVGNQYFHYNSILTTSVAQ